MTILITGVAGHIGSNIANRLLGEGNEVVGVDNFITGSKENLKILLSNPKFVFIKASIEEQWLKDELAAYHFEEIYHLACPTGVPNLERLSEEMLSATSIGTRNILKIAQEHKSRFLLASSSEVYGEPNIFPQTEEYTGNVQPTGMRSPYEEGKRFSESLVAAFVRKHKLDAKIARIFNTYGPNMSWADQRVVPRFLDQALSGKALTVHGGGLQRRTLLYIDDLVSGLVLILRDGDSGEIYNIGSDKECSILEVANLILKLTNSKSRILFTQRPPHDHQARMPSLEKINKLGWQPKTSLELGLQKTLESLKEKIEEDLQTQVS